MQKSISSSRGATASERVQRERGRRAFVRRRIVPWLFVLPILLINIAVVAGPASSALYYSMTDWNGIGAASSIQLEKFQTLDGDTGFRYASGITSSGRRFSPPPSPWLWSRPVC